MDNKIRERMNNKREKIKNNIKLFICLVIFLVSIISISFNKLKRVNDDIVTKKIQDQLIIEKNKSYSIIAKDEIDNTDDTIQILDEYESLYEINNEIIGWLYINGTDINYPVMQSKNDEEYYLNNDFYRNKNINGSLVLDTECNAGIGTEEEEYSDAGMESPSTNLIIHGHNMKTGLMFGELEKFIESDYGIKHSIISFDSLYERREYELISTFFSEIYTSDEEAFRYYNFYQANNQQEFDEFYENIIELSLYDTGVDAEYGDEFITLSTCSNLGENQRFIVIGKRIK